MVPYQRQELGAQLEISLGGEVAFGQDGVGVVFDRSMLANRVTPRSATEGATVRELRQLVRGSPPDSLRADVAHLVALRLLDGRSDLAGVAARLRLSPRALQRQLAFERTSYQRVLDRVRHDLACRLLLETRLCVAEMADRLGYADHPHLTRAFRRLAGCSPSEFRAASLSG